MQALFEPLSEVRTLHREAFPALTSSSDNASIKLKVDLTSRTLTGGLELAPLTRPALLSQPVVRRPRQQT